MIELVSIEISDAAKCATKHIEPFSVTHLESNAEDRKQSEEGEIILVQQKIGEKVYSNGKPIKFPPVSDNIYSLVLVDMRGYLAGTGGDIDDYHEIASGIYGLKPEDRWKAHFWKDGNGKSAPIKGIFDKNNPLHASKTLQERIHFIGFADEKEYGQGELLNQIHYIGNPTLFDSDESLKAVYNKMPFRKEGAILDC